MPAAAERYASPIFFATPDTTPLAPLPSAAISPIFDYCFLSFLFDDYICCRFQPLYASTPRRLIFDYFLRRFHDIIWLFIFTLSRDACRHVYAILLPLRARYGMPRQQRTDRCRWRRADASRRFLRVACRTKRSRSRAAAETRCARSLIRSSAIRDALMFRMIRLMRRFARIAAACRHAMPPFRRACRE